MPLNTEALMVRAHLSLTTRIFLEIINYLLNLYKTQNYELYLLKLSYNIIRNSIDFVSFDTKVEQ